MTPAGNVALVLIGHAQSEPIQFDATGLREVKNVFVAIVEKPFGTNRLKVTEGANCCSRFPVESAAPTFLLAPRRVAHRATATTIVDRD